MTPNEIRAIAFSSSAQDRDWLLKNAAALALLVAEMGEALEACLQYGTDEEDREWVCIDPRGVKPARAALAKLSKLEAR
jgi:hypothetical protein